VLGINKQNFIGSKLTLNYRENNMKTYNVYLMNFQPEPMEQHRREGFGAEKEARNYINNPNGAVVGDLWLIVKIPARGNGYELIDFVRR